MQNPRLHKNSLGIRSYCAKPLLALNASAVAARVRQVPEVLRTQYARLEPSQPDPKQTSDGVPWLLGSGLTHAGPMTRHPLVRPKLTVYGLDYIKFQASTFSLAGESAPDRRRRTPVLLQNFPTCMSRLPARTAMPSRSSAACCALRASRARFLNVHSPRLPKFKAMLRNRCAKSSFNR